MEKLKGKTILIGKEPGQGRLLVAVDGRTAAMGSPGCVPASVSRCRVADGMAHAKITVDSAGNLSMTNMKPQNVTYVNGSEIATKRITSSSAIALGRDQFNINLPVVLEAAKRILGDECGSPGAIGVGSQKKSAPVRQFGISHLERVWADFHDRNLEIKERQRQHALMARVPMFFTMGGGVISGLAVANDWAAGVKTLCIAMTVIGLLIMIYSFIKSKNDSSLEEAEQAMEEFQDSYVCPNPECGKFLGNMSYKLMKKQYGMHCPYCKSEFVEK